MNQRSFTRGSLLKLLRLCASLRPPTRFFQRTAHAGDSTPTISLRAGVFNYLTVDVGSLECSAERHTGRNRT